MSNRSTMHTAKPTGQKDAQGNPLYDIYLGSECVATGVRAQSESFGTNHVSKPQTILVKLNDGKVVEADVV